jgi:hypothetical protein
MIPIRILRNGEIEELRSDSVYETILNICNQHKEEQRALAFAFIVHNYSSPQLNKVLADEDYWQSLDKISGHLLTVFYLPSHALNFGENLLGSTEGEKRAMHELSVDGSRNLIIPMIKNYLQYDQPIRLPTILFFQTNGHYIQDFFFVELSEEKIEDSFIELKTYISGAVNELKKVKPEYYANSQEIFELLKNGVKALNFKRKVAEMTENFPFQQFIGWLIGLAS